MPSMKEYRTLLQNTVIKGNATSEEVAKSLKLIFGYIDKIRPKKLFRFRTCTEYNFDALLNDRIYFNAPKNFNDPHDCFSYVNNDKIQSLLNEVSLDNTMKQFLEIRGSTHLIKDSFSPNILPAIQTVYNAVKKMNDVEFFSWEKYLEANVVDYSKLKAYIANMIAFNHDEHIRLSREETFIACMTTDIKSTLMWAHYADYHKGFALEYDTDQIVTLAGKCSVCQNKCDMEHTLGLYPVVYGKDRFDATDYELETLNLRINNYFYGFNEPFCIPDRLFYIKANSFKGLNWKYEKEWRLIYTCNPKHPSIKYDVVKPKAIYLGSQMSASSKGIIKKLIEGKGLTVHEMFMDDSKEKYALSYKTL